MSRSDEGPAIAAFWTWFLKSEQHIRAAYDDGDAELLDSLITPAVTRLSPHLNWELGPYALPKYGFVLSPQTRESVALARAVVASAPRHEQWMTFCGRPPKALESLTFELDGTEFCCDEWRYRLTSYNSGEFVDIEIFYEDSNAPPAGGEDALCELVVEALVGELIALERVGYIDHEQVERIEQVEKATPMRYLGDHLKQVLSASN